jgi:hypothetical protein
LFDRVGRHSAEIRRIRQSLKEDALNALQSAAARSRRSRSSGRAKNKKAL